ncbi:MAG: DUF2975 domain-containing protein [Cyclobacteriaceae bacterium]|nr:DUF2975 domain-containing protein [Cyclobacteriaceae bacterium]
MKIKRKISPQLFLMLKIILIMNGLSSILLTMLLTGSLMVEGYMNGFDAEEARLPVVKIRDAASDSLLQEAEAYTLFSRPMRAELRTELPYISRFIVPLIDLRGMELSILNLFCYSLVTYLLFRFIHDLSLERPYHLANHKRLIVIGIVLIVWDFIRFNRDHLILNRVVHNLTEGQFRYDFPGEYYKVGLGVMVIIGAMIYKRGISLQQESELVI